MSRVPGRNYKSSILQLFIFLFIIHSWVFLQGLIRACLDIRQGRLGSPNKLWLTHISIQQKSNREKLFLTPNIECIREVYKRTFQVQWVLSTKPAFYEIKLEKPQKKLFFRPYPTPLELSGKRIFFCFAVFCPTFTSRWLPLPASQNKCPISKYI